MDGSWKRTIQKSMSIRKLNGWKWKLWITAYGGGFHVGHDSIIQNSGQPLYKCAASTMRWSA